MNSALLSLRAYAKINLDLRIIAKRSDGFHELETLMAPVSLYDELHFFAADAYALRCSTPGVPLDGSNLVSKARELFVQASGCKADYVVELVKNVPHGAGLGGGSSDAAAALVGFNRLAGNVLGQQQLSELAAAIGSDVAFFLHDCWCRCKGRGELIEALPGDWQQPVLLLKPAFGVSTPQAYRDYAKFLGQDNQSLKQSWGDLQLCNDLELPVFAKYPLLEQIKLFLLQQKGVQVSMMSGSGSTMYALLQPDCDLKQLQLDVQQCFGDCLWMWHGACAAHLPFVPFA